MRFISESGYSIKVGQEEAHQRWLEANEEALAASMPEGVRYLGTFVTVFTSEKQSGFYKTYLELDSYGAQDRLAAATKDPNSEFGTPAARAVSLRRLGLRGAVEQRALQGGRRRHDLRSARLIERVLSSRDRIGSS